MKKIYSLLIFCAALMTMAQAVAQESHPGVRYDGSITIDLFGSKTTLENQSVYIVNSADGTSCEFALYDFSLDGESSIGSIEVPNVKIVSGADNIKNYSGAKDGIELAEGDIIANCTLDGTETSDGTMAMNIHVVWVMDPTNPESNDPIEVTFNGKKVPGQTSGIDDIATSADAKVVKVYNQNGMELSEPAKGLNIVVYSDGTVVKIMNTK